jgi:hypothetical protein
MAAFNKFNDFVEQLGLKTHNLNTDVIAVALSNTAPSATDTVLALGGAHPPPASANGYATSSNDIQNTWSENPAGTGELVAVDLVITASGGTIGPFRYVILYNYTNSPTIGNLIGWYDYGTSITLQDTETFTVDFDTNVLTLA